MTAGAAAAGAHAAKLGAEKDDTQMAKSGRQTFKKRQKELAKKQKKEDKARRLAARRNKDGSEEKEERTEKHTKSDEDKPTLKITPVGGSSPKSEKP